MSRLAALRREDIGMMVISLTQTSLVTERSRATVAATRNNRVPCARSASSPASSLLSSETVSSLFGTCCGSNTDIAVATFPLFLQQQ